MPKPDIRHRLCRLVVAALSTAIIGGCASAYYSAMEKVGVHKRDILIDRVEGARDAQAIGSLKAEFASLKKNIDGLIRNMNASIKDSEQFIANIRE